jgi:hypothetical protein
MSLRDYVFLMVVEIKIARKTDGDIFPGHWNGHGQFNDNHELPGNLCEKVFISFVKACSTRISLMRVLSCPKPCSTSIELASW